MTLDLLLAVQRLVDELDAPAPYRAAVILLALKERSATPMELAYRCDLSSTAMRQWLRRQAARPKPARLLERCGRGRYRLTLRGHRRANELAGVGVHVLLPRIRAGR